jgi:hypothetical protein
MAKSRTFSIYLLKEGVDADSAAKTEMHYPKISRRQSCRKAQPQAFAAFSKEQRWRRSLESKETYRNRRKVPIISFPSKIGGLKFAGVSQFER